MLNNYRLFAELTTNRAAIRTGSVPAKVPIALPNSVVSRYFSGGCDHKVDRIKERVIGGKEDRASLLSLSLSFSFSIKKSGVWKRWRMGSLAKKGLQQYLLQLQHHPLRTKVPGYLSCAFVILYPSDLCVFLVDGKFRDWEVDLSFLGNQTDSAC